MVTAGRVCHDPAAMPSTILLVDDHAAFRERARVLLEAEGFAVVGEAADGRTALLEAARLHPDIALVDVGLPGLDGFAVAAGLRAAGSAPLIVLISGRDRADFGDRVDAAAVDGFIAKADLSGDLLTRLMG